MSGSSKSIGYALLAAGGALAALVLLWLAVSGVNAGGFVLGLILLVVLVGPLAGAGWFMLGRGRAEAVDEAQFTSKRRILEADRLFRAELAAELRQLARRPGRPAARLAELAEDLERRTYDSPDWYDTVQLDDADAATLRRYDDLVWERTRALGAATEGDQSAGVAALQEALDQRRALLVRGRRAPDADPSAMLRAGEARRGDAAVRDLSARDAVTLDGEDYLVEGVATYFAEGRSWRMARLAPSGPNARERWLYVGPAGVDVALLDEQPGGSGPEADALPLDGAAVPLAQRGTATADVVGPRGGAEGVLVTYALYRAGASLGYAEAWPDGAHHAYGGRTLRSSDLEVWPSSVRAGAS